ncbi:MAG TPA: AMP-binding protein [Candidatus Eisenbacteria bacterium]|jgi:phenylacetate-CoA ligase
MSQRPFSAVELAEREEAQRTARRLLVEQLRYVRAASVFYRRKLGSGPDLGPEDLPELPFTTKDELRKAQAVDPPFGELRAAGLTDIVRLHVTSGTTGRPLAIGFTRADLELSCEVGARAYWAAGVREDDVLLHCLNYALYVGGLADHLSIERIGATMVPIGIGQSQRVLDLWWDLRPSAMFCTPSYARHLAEVARRRGVDPRTLGLRLVVVGGEPGGDVPSIRQSLEAMWGAEVGDAYGLGEVWPTFAGQCEARDGFHMTAPDALWWELVDPGNGEPVPAEPGAEGEIVYTHLRRQATPLVRYRSRDVVRMLGECSCGRTTPRFRLLGRADSMFIVRGVNVFPQAIEAVLSELAVGHGAFAVLLDDPTPIPPIPLVVEFHDPAPDLARRVEETVRARLQCRCSVRAVPMGRLGLGTEHKSRRVFRTYLGERPPGLEPAASRGEADGR